jgi:hypothetical protein
MTPELKRIITPFVLMTLLATATTNAADTGMVDHEKESVVAGKMLADTAITAAVEDAIEAVLADTRTDLDIRFNARTSMTSVDDLKARL